MLIGAEAFGNKAIADPGLGLNVLLAGIGFEFLAQLADKNAEILRLMGRLCAPDGGEEGSMGYDLAGVTGKVKSSSNSLGVRWTGFPSRVKL